MYEIRQRSMYVNETLIKNITSFRSSQKIIIFMRGSFTQTIKVEIQGMR